VMALGAPVAVDQVVAQDLAAGADDDRAEQAAGRARVDDDPGYLSAATSPRSTSTVTVRWPRQKSCQLNSTFVRPSSGASTTTPCAPAGTGSRKMPPKFRAAMTRSSLRSAMPLVSVSPGGCARDPPGMRRGFSGNGRADAAFVTCRGPCCSGVVRGTKAAWRLAVDGRPNQFVLKAHSRCNLDCDHCYADITIAMRVNDDKDSRGRPAVYAGHRLIAHCYGRAFEVALITPEVRTTRSVAGAGPRVIQE